MVTEAGDRVCRSKPLKNHLRFSSVSTSACNDRLYCSLDLRCKYSNCYHCIINDLLFVSDFYLLQDYNQNSIYQKRNLTNSL